MEEAMQWMAENWDICLLGLYVCEKAIRLSPSKKDDVIFDMILKPVWDAVSSKIEKKESK
jgi:hypothetical protein